MKVAMLAWWLAFLMISLGIAGCGKQSTDSEGPKSTPAGTKGVTSQQESPSQIAAEQVVLAVDGMT